MNFPLDCDSGAEHIASLPCGVITVSDTRTPETDHSGQFICTALQESGHRVERYCILRDEPQLIREQVQDWAGSLPVILLNGGTGIAPRDTTYDAIEALLEKTLARLWGDLPSAQLRPGRQSGHRLSGHRRDPRKVLDLFPCLAPQQPCNWLCAA
jgi:molybdenum cofactor synthesis domain-containing protein